jgi:hypothetical protein
MENKNSRYVVIYGDLLHGIEGAIGPFDDEIDGND